jgi:nucleotide-binding universal stress UspA family protein
MATNTPIVVGVDSQPGTAAAIAQAARLASASSRGLIAVRVAELPDNIAMMEGYAAHPVDLHAVFRKEAEADLGRALVSVGGEVPIERRVCLGSVASELHRVAKDTHASLLVVGTNREQDAREIGVVASQCVRMTSIPILVVASNQSGAFHRILACVDFSKVSAEVVRIAGEVALRDRSHLTVLHIHHPNRTPAVQNPIEDGPDVCENLRGHLRRFWLDNAPGGLSPEFVVVEHARADKAINAHASRDKADLAILGTRGRWSAHDRFLGTTAERMLRNACVSLFAIPPVVRHL